VTSADEEVPGLLQVLARLGGTPRPLLRRIAAPSEKRIRPLIQALDAAALNEIIGGWLRACSSGATPAALSATCTCTRSPDGARDGRAVPG
jgi:hypothetical protein